MTRTRAATLSVFAGLGFFYCVSRIEQVVFALSMQDPPSREWAVSQLLRWSGGAFGLLMVATWAIYKIWLLWDA
jgi:hypothetical protein